MSEQIEREWLPCIICGSSHTKSAFSVKRKSPLFEIDEEIEFHYEQCLNCGLVYLNPRPSFDWMKGLYPDPKPSDLSAAGISPNIADPWPRNYFGLAYWYRDIFVPSINKLPIPRGRVLEYCCRIGRFLKLLKEKYGWHEIYGVDFRPSFVDEAKQYAKEVVCTWFLREANFPDNFFDLVVTRHFIEHLYDPVEELKEAYRILKPGGFLYVEVPNIAGVGYFLFRSKWVGIYPPRHVNLFSPETLCMLLEKVGFRVKNVSSPPWPNYLMGSFTLTLKKSAIGRLYKILTRRKLIQDLITFLLYLLFLPISTIAALCKKGDEIVVIARALK